MVSDQTQTTILTVANTLQAMADAEFAMWLERQSSAVRAMTEAEQIEIWADPSLLDQPRNPWEGFRR